MVSLYEQLDLKLEGHRNGKYSDQQLSEAREKHLRKNNEILRELLQQVTNTLKMTDKADATARTVGGLVLEGKAEIQEESDAIDAARSGWGGLIRSTFSWNDLSNLQQEFLDRDMELVMGAFEAITTTRKTLLTLIGYLEKFKMATDHAIETNNLNVVMELDVEDILKIYKDNLSKTRKEIDGLK
jgi:hypothetical protein